LELDLEWHGLLPRGASLSRTSFGFWLRMEFLASFITVDNFELKASAMPAEDCWSKGSQVLALSVQLSASLATKSASTDEALFPRIGWES
jgi:hypothetical protein